MDNTNRHIAIVGACVRPAAMSALRAKLIPRCADLFADRDLLRMAPASKLERESYPSNASRIIDDAVSGPWCYTGGLENYPGLIDNWSRRRTLLGNTGDTLRQIRDPFKLATVLRANGVSCPDCRSEPPMKPAERWLNKPRHGCGGKGIEVWCGQDVAAQSYFQQFTDGESVSGVFAGHAGRCQLLGVTRQLVGTPWLNAPDWHYCGSIGPLKLGPELKEHWQHIGNVLVEAFGLRGLFGVDAVLCKGQPWVIEVNPRYTSSVEILEFGTGIAAFNLHSTKAEPFAQIAVQNALRCAGKAIIYAHAEFQFPENGPWDLELQKLFDSSRLPEFADIPHIGEEFSKGMPVITLFAMGLDEADCERQLRNKVHTVKQLFLTANT